MASHRQFEANRKNSARSTGPKTEAGKDRSSKNAITHGLTAEKTFTELTQCPLEERIICLASTYQPDSTLDLFHIQQAAVESTRIEQARLDADSHVRIQTLRAKLCWQDDRASQAADRFDKIRKRPARTVRALETTKQGCERLLDEWNLLGSLPKTGRAWDLPQCDRVLDLLGIDPDYRQTCTRIPETAGNQVELLKSEVSRLEKKRDGLIVLDELERNEAMRGFAPPDRVIQLLRRYEASSRRNFDASMKYLESIRMKEEKPRIEEPKPAEPRDAIKANASDQEETQIEIEAAADDEPTGEISEPRVSKRQQKRQQKRRPNHKERREMAKLAMKNAG